MVGIKEKDLAYFAGIVDGEGTISMDRHSSSGKAHPSPYFSPTLYITNTSKDLLLKAQELFGGSIGKHQRQEQHKIVYRWRLFGKKAIIVITLLRPFLMIKQAQADIVIAYEMRPKDKLTGKLYALTIEEREHRESVVNQIRELNKRGV